MNTAVKGRAIREERYGWIAWMTAMFFLSSLFTPPSSAASSDNTGTKSGNFLKIATDARGVALGNLMTSMTEGADSLRWNPAGLARTPNKEVAGTHVQYYQGVQIENVAYAHPMGDGGLGVNLFYLSAGELDGRDAFQAKTGDFTFYDLVGGIGYGHQIYTHSEGMDIAVGGQVKIVQEKIADVSYQNPAFDIGLLATPFEHLSAGVVVRNLASSKADFAREISGSATYNTPFWKPFTGGLGVTYAEDAPLRYNVGAEYRMPEYYNTAVRVGYQNTDNLTDSEDSAIPSLRGAGLAGLRMGFGLEYTAPQLRGIKLGADYAMAPFAALGIAHTITVRIKW